MCTISDECFEVPPGYRKLVRGGRGMADQEEELLQMAIQQSLLEQERGGTNEEVEEVEVCMFIPGPKWHTIYYSEKGWG